MMREIRGILP